MRLVSKLVIAVSCLGYSWLPTSAHSSGVIDSVGSTSFEAMGLEWMRWDATTGLSINSALDLYGSDGWRLASNVELADLLTGLGVSSYDGELTFDYDENTGIDSWDPSTHGGYYWFEDLFGYTSDPSGLCDLDVSGCYYHSSALFGEDGDGDGLYNLFDYEYEQWSDNSSSYVTMSSDQYDANFANDTLTYEWYGETSYKSGVALVRNVTPMPWPSPIAMFLSGLSFLYLVKHRRQLKSKLSFLKK